MVVVTKDKLPKFTEYNELASEKNGGKILFATDDWFAAAENLLKDEEPVWKEGLFTECGKWMDGWETRRKRCSGHDWTIVALGRASIVKGVCVDTAHFTGNYAPRFSIQAARLTAEEASKFPKREGKIGTEAGEDGIAQVSLLKTEKWKTLVPMTKLGAGYEASRRNYFEVTSDETWTHLRLNIFPDGGVARLRVYGLAAPLWNAIDREEPIDLIASENGGVCVGYSDAHYGHPRNLIRQGSGINMGDGWETARRLDRPPVLEADDSGILQVPGSEWAMFKLGHIGEIHHIQVDTKFFKGNFPDNVKIEGVYARPGESLEGRTWKTIMSPKKMSPDKKHNYIDNDLAWHGPVSHVKITMAPDGGLSRVRLWGFMKNQ